MFIFDLLSSITHLLPTKQDNTLNKVIKGVNVVSAIKNEYDGHITKELVKKYKESYNELLYSCISDDAVLSKTNFTTIKIKDYDYDMNFMHFAEIPGVFKYMFKSKGKSPVRDKMGNPYFYSTDADCKHIGDLLYSKYGNKIFIDQKVVTRRKSDVDEYSFESMKLDDKIIEFDAHKKATKLLEKKGIYLFYGKPGTGKSSFIFSESFKDKRCLIMLASMFCDLKQNELATLLNVFNPDLLLIEEFDKATNKLDSILLFFERLRSKNITVVLTANNIKNFDPAVIRPKRIDKIAKFDPPNQAEIKELVNMYSSDSPENNAKLIDLLEKAKFTHAYVVDLAKKLNNNLDELEAYIKFLKLVSKNESE